LCGFKILNMSLNIIFTWWNKQTFGTFLKTLFYGKYVGKDEFKNKYYKSKNDERWVVYSSNIEATKISSEWYLWIHHTVNKIPDQNVKKKYLWQKNHLENQTGSNNSHRPVKIKRSDIQKKYETWK
jgi:NADH:ubiquinone oxidoreductase subunit